MSSEYNHPTCGVSTGPGEHHQPLGALAEVSVLKGWNKALEVYEVVGISGKICIFLETSLFTGKKEDTGLYLGADTMALMKSRKGSCLV